MLLLPKFLAGFSGGRRCQVGYAGSSPTALLGLPVLLLVWLAGRVHAQPRAGAAQASPSQ
jgi:MFS transporter, PAT family, beta-lactamase induction signal transducer AmpG